MIDKNRALDDFMEMTEGSWSWQRLTEEEKKRFKSKVLFHTILFGDYRQRYKILNNVYNAYLIGLGYDPMGWRNDKV